MRRYALALTLAVLSAAVLGCQPRPALTFAPAALPAARTGHPYQVSLTVSRNVTPVGRIYVAAGTLPRGLALADQRGDSSAEISGTPAAAGRFEFTIAAWCLGTNTSGQAGQRDYVLVVK